MALNVAIVYLFWSFACTVINGDLRFQQEDGKLSLYEKEQLILSYQIDTKSLNGEYPRANYVHPLNDFSGSTITEDFPEDHLHHRGIFWTWHQLYVDGQSVSDPWVCENISWKVSNVKHQVKKGKASIQAEVDWLIGSNQEPMVKEQVEIIYQGMEDHYTLDFNIELQSLKDRLEIGGSDDVKGYGGFSPRLALGENTTFSDAGGAVTPQNEQVDAGNWMWLTDIGGSKSNVVIMYHPKSTASLKGWILRKARSMQNPVWPGRERVQLNRGDQVEIMARLVVFREKTDQKIINELYQNYSR